MSKKTLVAFLLIALAICLSACSSKEESEPSAKASGDAVSDAKITIIDYSFSPKKVILEKGGRVVWANKDAANHHIVFENYEWEPEEIHGGMEMDHRFQETGEFKYSCSLHPTNTEEQGVIVVE